MKTIILAASSFAVLAGCSFAARSPEMYRDDTTAALQTKNNDIRACYDGVLKGTPSAAGKVTVKFDVVEDGADKAGTVQNVAVDKAGTTAPDAVADCVKTTITGVQIKPPADKRKGQATYSWEFSAPPPAAAPKT